MNDFPFTFQVLSQIQIREFIQGSTNNWGRGDKILSRVKTRLENGCKAKQGQQC